MSKQQTVEEFLAQGGTIQVIPQGVTNGHEGKQLKGEAVRDLYRQINYRRTERSAPKRGEE